MNTSTAYDWRHLEATAELPIWISTDQALAEHCARWMTLPLIALDTEFLRVDTFYPIPGLVQVADDKATYLIDPITIEDFEPLCEVFRNPRVLKVMHAATEDLELFLRFMGEVPRPLYDTQIAAAFLNWGFSMGLQRLLMHTLDVEVAKKETTSNWLQRPLTPSQEKYAALDVAYLPAVYQRQHAELIQDDKFDWVLGEGELMLKAAPDTDPEGFDYYKRFSQMWGLSPERMAGLRDLTAWRERMSREEDVPRNRILRNQNLLEIVTARPKTMSDLSRLKDIKHRIIRIHGETILALVNGGEESAKEQAPEPIPRALPYEWNTKTRKLKSIVKAKARELEIAPEVLLRRKELEAIMRTGVETGEFSLPAGLTEWREKHIGQPLLVALQQMDNEE